MAMVAGKRSPASTLYPVQKDWMVLSHPHSSGPSGTGSSLRESLVQFAVEDTRSSGETASGENGRLNPLRMDTTTEAGSLLDNHFRLQNKTFLLVI